MKQHLISSQWQYFVPFHWKKFLRMVLSYQFGFELYFHSKKVRSPLRIYSVNATIVFIYIWVFFDEHSQFTEQQGKREGIYLTPLYYFHSLHRHLDISRTITADSSPLHIASSRTRTGNLWFPSASRQPLSYATKPVVFCEFGLIY